jgi:anthranilate synthase component 2
MNMMKILLLDNYDSFTFNIAHYLREITGQAIPVIRNDQISLEEVGAYDAIVLSPGPGLPADAGIMPEIIRKYAPVKKILGICLGMQAIGEVFGGTLLNLPAVYHGVATPATIIAPDEILFRGLPGKIQVGRYHSWVVDENNLPKDLEITAIDDSGRIMALRHRHFDVRGVQFHPESVLTPDGKTMIRNWISQ